MSENDPDAAISFLRDLIENTKDPRAREALFDKLRRAYISRTVRELERLVNVYEGQTGKKLFNLSELVDAHLLKFVPEDGFGGTYRWDPEKQAVETTSGEKGLEFYGKTAETGIYQQMKE